ncbi:uncharacterized protein [Euwallacea similis]|uniref:uncharacterized protein n=1 Tax=Euwallacea similis TaxID=1736056 RepID=UPI003450BE8A
MEKVFLLFVSIVSWECFFGVHGGITVDGSKCGQRVCKLNQYCSDLDRTCQECANVCNKSLIHNYEESICESQCQDYLHDLRYVRKDADDDDSDLRSIVARLSRTVTITLTLVVLLMVVLACALIFQLYRCKAKKNITWDVIKGKIFKKNDSSRDTTQNQNGNNRRDLKLEMPSTTINSDHSPVTVSTSIDRRPAEDSALDYAYDNPAMNKTPNRY